MSDANCIFCKISDGKIPAKKIAENDDFFCIPDIQPQAPKHLLVIPKKHLASLESVYEGSNGESLVGGLFSFAHQVAKQERLLPGGYRSIINTGKEGGQTVFHLHLHLLGGKTMSEEL